MNIRQWYRGGQGLPGGFEPEYQAVLDRAVFLGYNTPDSNTNTRNNLRVKYLKDIGVWSLFDIFYIFDNPTGLSEFSKLNYANPSNFELFNQDTSLEPNFIPNLGFKGDGTKWFNTGFRLVSDTININNAESTFGFKGFDWLNTGAVFGARTGPNTSQLLLLCTSSTSTLYRLKNTQNPTGNSTPSFDLNRHLYLQSTSPTNARVRTDGVNKFICGQTTANFSDLELYLFAYNENNSAVGITDQGGISYYFAGGQTNTFENDIYNIMQDTYNP